MNHPNVYEGIKIIRTAEFLRLLALAMTLVSFGGAALSGWMLKPGNQAGPAIALTMVAAFLLSILFSLISLLRILKGCGIAGRVDDNYNNAKFILIVAMLANIASAVLNIMMPARTILFRLANAGAGICEAISVFFIVRTTNRLLAAGGETELSASTSKTIALIASLLVAGAFVPALGSLPNMNGIVAAAGVLGAVLSAFGALIYLGYLNKAVKALQTI